MKTVKGLFQVEFSRSVKVSEDVSATYHASKINVVAQDAEHAVDRLRKELPSHATPTAILNVNLLGWIDFA